MSAASRWPRAAPFSSTRSPTSRCPDRPSCSACWRRGATSASVRRGRSRPTSASNADLRAEVAAGRFRQDLLFRLNTIEIHLPPLRERPEDLEPLAIFFLQQLRGRYRKDITGFDPAASAALRAHHWPGNVRELSHAIERSVLLSDGPTIRAVDLGLVAARDAVPRLEEMTLDEVERYLVRQTLARCGGNAMKAAELLGLSRSAFYRRLEKHGL